MRYFSFIVALSALLHIGCQTDESISTNTTDYTTLSVSTAESVRTSLGAKTEADYPVYWSEGDRLSVNGTESQTATINAEDRTNATFKVSGNLSYPLSITYPHCPGSTIDKAKVTFLAEQSYVEGSFSNGSAPMCGYAAANSNNVVLKHLAGVLRFAIRSKEGEQTILKSVSIHSSKALAGEFEVDCQSGAIVPTANTSKSIILSLPSNFTLSSSEDNYLYIAVPHGTLGLCDIIFTDANGKMFRAQWNGSTVKAGLVREFKSVTFHETNEPVQLEDMVETIVDEWATDLGYTIKGYVRSNGNPLVDVVVSDGLLCTKTNANGFYSLKSNLADTKFVMVSIPSGYTAPTDSNGLPIFYHRVTDSEKSKNLCIADFSFNKISNNAERFTLLVGADPQPRASAAGYDNNAYHALDCCNDLYRDMREKAETITDRNVLGLMLGDIVHENMNLFDNYIAGLKTLGFPMFNIIGNHDNDTSAKSDVEGRRKFEEKLGPTYYSFNVGKLHFVVLDNLIMKLNSDGALKSYDQGLTEEIWQWLQSDLSYVDRSATLMVAAHSPMFKLISGGNRGAQHKNDYGYLFAEFAKAHIWTGHSHTTYNYNYSATSEWGAIEEHTVARSTGELWTNEYLSGGTPRGYTVVEVDGDDVKWYFKPTIYQTGSFVSTSKYTSKKPSYTYRDWDYSSGVAKMKSDKSTLSEAYQMKVYKPGQYHDTYADMIAGNAANKYVYVNVFLWDDKWEKPKYNGVEMEHVGHKDAYCLATYEIQNHYNLYGYTLKKDEGYVPSDNDIHTIFRAYEPKSSGSGTVTVTDRFGNEYSQSVSW